jgi:hypothetical protein
MDRDESKVFAELTDAQVSKLVDVFTELVDIERDMDEALRVGDYKYDKARLHDKMEKWLQEARNIARELAPSSLTVGAEIGLPPRVSVSFTWASAPQPKGE